MTTTCPRCGHTHDPSRCQGHVVKDPLTREPIDPRQCGKTPVKGATVCRSHGAAKGTPAASAAEQRLLARQALLAAESFGLPREVDPHTALLEELHRTAGAVQWLGAIVADLDRGDLVWGRVRDKVGGEDAGRTYEARPNAFLSLWQGERKHLVEVSRACISAGIEERRVRVAEQAGQQLASVVRAVLDAVLTLLIDALGPYEAALQVLREVWGPAVLDIVPRELRRLGDGGDE